MSTVMDKANALINLYDDLHEIRHGHKKIVPGNAQANHLGKAMDQITANRTGKEITTSAGDVLKPEDLEKAQAWDQFTYQRARFYHALCFAVGVKSGDQAYEHVVAQERSAKAPIPGYEGDQADRLAMQKYLAEHDHLEVDQAIGEKLDQEVSNVLSELNQELKAATDSNTQQAIQKKIELLKKMGKERHDYEYGVEYLPKNGFRALVEETDEACCRLDQRYYERDKLSRGLGMMHSSRHNEAKYPGLYAWINTPQFKVVGSFKVDPETGLPKVSADVYRIPLFGSKGIQMAAGQLLGAYYEPLYRGKPVEKTIKDKDGNPILKDGKPQIVYQQEKDENGKPKVDDKGNPVYKKDKQGNLLPEYETDANGNILLEPLSPEERDEIIKKPFPLGRVPTGFAPQTIKFIMDMQVLNTAMGGPGVFGFDQAKYNSGQCPFDMEAIHKSVQHMEEPMKTAFLVEMEQNWKVHYDRAEKRYNENVLLPSIYQAGQNDPRVAAMRILAKESDQDPMSYTEQQLDAYIQNPANKTKIDKMLKKPLDNQGKQFAWKRHQKFVEEHPDDPTKPGVPGQGRRLEQEYARNFFMDTSAGGKSNKAVKQATVGNAGQTAPAQQASVGATDPATAAAMKPETAPKTGISVTLNKSPTDEEVRGVLKQAAGDEDLPPGIYAVDSIGITPTPETNLNQTVTATGTSTNKPK